MRWKASGSRADDPGREISIRTLILSDLHANWEATRAALTAARDLGFDRAAVLGDLVGYGGSPEEVVREVRELAPEVVIRGNHDRVVSGIEDGEDFNFLAIQAALMNRRLLSQESRRYLAELPSGPLPLLQGCIVAHGSPRDEDEYVVDVPEAAEIFQQIDFNLCLFGHTHIPCVFRRSAAGISRIFPAADGTRVALRPGERLLLNPGSVGQPRDEDPRASFLLLDEERREAVFHRVAYPIQQAQLRILEAGIPPLLAQRLERGV